MSRVAKAYDKEDIKAMIWKMGSTLRQISVQAGLNAEAGGHSLANPKPAANRAISEFLAIPLHQLWPSWYDQNGNRIAAQRHCKNLARPSRRVSAKSAHSI